MPDIEIESEEDAFKILDRVLRGDFAVDNLPELSFGDHTAFQYLDPAGNSSVDVNSIRALTAVQNQVYKTYAYAKTGEPDARRLTDDEREQLKIQFRVRSGSSDIFAELGTAISRVLLQMADKLSPEQILLFGSFLVIMWTGKSAYKMHLDNSAKRQEEAAKSEERIEMFRTIREANAIPARQLKILEQTMSRIEQAPVASQIAGDTAHEVLRSVNDNSTATVNGLMIDGANAKAATRQPRFDTHEQIIDGQYIVVRVDSSATQGFRVRLRNEHSGDEINVGITDALVQADQREAIQSAEWSKSTLNVRMRVSTRAGKVVDASIIDAKQMSETVSR